jgi:poly-gamma-glutamate capsule biosynthesis protein CapA/YwtB (metallophosphatase superfamily)
MADELVTLFACGDVMPGRGIDQILPHPGDPELQEDYARDANAYVELAVRANGPIPRPAGFSWPWGEALPVVEEAAPDVRVINLETSVIRSADFAPGKAVHYRMNPDNLPCVAAIRPDVCGLANNHVLDFGERGLRETLAALAGAGLAAAGAGLDADQAGRPAAVRLPDGARLIVLCCGTASSGIPPTWAATATRPGINLLPSLSSATTDALIARTRAVRQDSDLVVVSIHWGSNWGYGVHPDQVRFARQLIDGGVDVIHGHSSHHPRPIEVYWGKLILYGCGDCIDDYEGITGYEEYRDDLRLLYFPSLLPDTGELAALTMVPLQARDTRLRHASAAYSRWLAATLGQISRKFGSRVEYQPDGRLIVHHAAGTSPKRPAERVADRPG